MKKAQSGMEFLMTYGWAIIVVLIALSALWYIGVLIPEQYNKDKCFCTYVNQTRSQTFYDNAGNKFVECYEVVEDVLQFSFYRCENQSLSYLNTLSISR